MSSIPVALRERERWVCWAYVDRGAGKPTKVPLYPKQPARHASVTDPATWSSYARACAVAEEFELGVGFVLGDGLVGFDLDDCVVDDGDGEFRIHPAAAEIVVALNSYTHLSPSRTGIHVVGEGRLDSRRHSTTATPWGGEFAAFAEGKYLTITEEVVEGRDELRPIDPQALDAVLARHLPPRGDPGHTTATDPPARAAVVDDVIDRCRRARNAEKFERLFGGDTSGYSSASEADLALLCLLAFYSRDPAVLDGAFRRSRLMRAKWDAHDYAARTIRAALSFQADDEVPSDPGPGDPGPQEADAAPPTAWTFEPFSVFAARELPRADPLLGTADRAFLNAGGLLMVAGPEGSGKSTWTIDGIIHLAAGADWLGIPVAHPTRCCLLENEGPASLFQRKLQQRLASWTGPDPRPNLFVFAAPWGEFTFADPSARAALAQFSDRHGIQVCAANPTLGLGVAATGKPDETTQFVAWLKQCGLGAGRAFWLAHHLNKAGQVSGDWGRHPDTVVKLRRDGNAQRTILDWDKTRWATLAPEDKLQLLDWIVETQGCRPPSCDFAPPRFTLRTAMRRAHKP
jgi:putative DNA primase/helicase